MTRFNDHINTQLNESIDDRGIFKAVFLSGQAGCFDGNTLIKTINGYVPIKYIHIGDIVYTKNEKTDNIELKEVNDILCYNETDDVILELEFDNGMKVICTDQHEFFVDGKWIKAKDL